MPATPPTTTTRSTNLTSGATWPRSAKPPRRRDSTSRTRRSLVVRNARDRATPGRRTLTQRSNPASPTRADRPLHYDDPGPGQRGRPRTRRRPGTATVSDQPGLGRKRFACNPGRPSRPSQRRPDAPGMQRPRGSSRLHELSTRTLPARAAILTTTSQSYSRIRRSARSAERDPGRVAARYPSIGAFALAGLGRAGWTICGSAGRRSITTRCDHANGRRRPSLHSIRCQRRPPKTMSASPG